MAHVKIRQLPDGTSRFRRDDSFVIAQSSGGNVTRKISASSLAGKLYSAGSHITINSSGVIAVSDKWQSQIDSLRVDFNNFKSSTASDISSLRSRMTQAESKITTLENKPAKEHSFVDLTYTHFGRSGSITNTYANIAKNLFSTLPKGSTLDVLWRQYWTYGTGNGSAAAQRFYLTRYSKTADSNSWSTTWTREVNGNKYRSGRDSYGNF